MGVMTLKRTGSIKYTKIVALAAAGCLGLFWWLQNFVLGSWYNGADYTGGYRCLTGWSSQYKGYDTTEAAIQENHGGADA